MVWGPGKPYYSAPAITYLEVWQIKISQASKDVQWDWNPLSGKADLLLINNAQCNHAWYYAKDIKGLQHFCNKLGSSVGWKDHWKLVISAAK